MTAEPVSDLEAARAEVENADHEFTTASGITYTCPRTPDWSARTIRATRRGEPEEALALLFGDEALDDFTATDMNNFFEQIESDEGLSEKGNSPGSSRSSRSTGTR